MPTREAIEQHNKAQLEQRNHYFQDPKSFEHKWRENRLAYYIDLGETDSIELKVAVDWAQLQDGYERGRFMGAIDSTEEIIFEAICDSNVQQFQDVLNRFLNAYGPTLWPSDFNIGPLTYHYVINDHIPPDNISLPREFHHITAYGHFYLPDREIHINDVVIARFEYVELAQGRAIIKMASRFINTRNGKVYDPTPVKKMLLSLRHHLGELYANQITPITSIARTDTDLAIKLEPVSSQLSAIDPKYNGWHNWPVTHVDPVTSASTATNPTTGERVVSIPQPATSWAVGVAQQTGLKAKKRMNSTGNSPKPNTQTQLAIHGLSRMRIDDLDSRGRVPNLNAIIQNAEYRISIKQLRKHAPELHARWEHKEYRKIWKYNEDTELWELSEL